jgi:hypothetical protein
MDKRSKHNPVSSIMDAQGLPEDQFLNAWGDDLVLDQGNESCLWLRLRLYDITKRLSLIQIYRPWRWV